MALIIVKRLIVVKEEIQNNRTSVITELAEDTTSARNIALQSLGFANTTGQSPDLTIDAFVNGMKTTYPTLRSIRIDDCIKDNDSDKYYYTFEINDDKYACENFWTAPETKKRDIEENEPCL